MSVVRGRAVLVTLALLALIALLVVVGVSLRTPTGTTTASPSPSPTATATAAVSPTPSPTATAALSPSPTAAASPAPSRVASAGFGLVVMRPDLVVRSETEQRAIVTLEPAGAPSTGGAIGVSPDGRRVAIWTSGGTGRNELRLWDAATPDRTAVLLTTADDERGTGIVWSPDGAGLLLASTSLTVQPGIDGPPDRTILRTMELSSRQVVEVTRAERTFFVPIAWDRARQVVAAVEVGAGGFARAYVLVRIGQVTRTPLTNVIFVSGSRDGSWVVASTDIQTQGRVIAWPLAEPTRVVELRPDAGDRSFAQHGSLPRSTRVVVEDRPRVVTGAYTARLFLWDPASGERLAIPNGTTMGIALPRADGTALYVSGEGGALSVMDVKTGAREPLTAPTDRPLAGVILR